MHWMETITLLKEVKMVLKETQIMLLAIKTMPKEIKI